MGNTQISAGEHHTVGLKSNGTVVAVGLNDYGQCNVSDWSGITQIVAGMCHTVGLKSDGTVVAVGYNGGRNGQCNVSDLSGITRISAGMFHTVGLKNNGTVVAVGDNSKGQCNVNNWSGITQISAGYYHTVGLKSDGTVVTVGDNNSGQCNVSGWSGITQISAGYYHTVGLKNNGTVVTVGDNNNGQCNVSGWSDITQIVAGERHTVGLKNNGTVVAIGGNNYGQCNVSGWSGITRIVAGEYHTLGLKSDGTVVVVGDNSKGQCNVNNWHLKCQSDALYQYKKPLIFTGCSAVNGFNISGQEPAGTARRVAFKKGDKYIRLTNTSGTAAEANLTTQAITCESVLAEGNTVAELSALTSVPTFLNSEVYPIFALHADENIKTAPTLKMAVKTTINADTYQRDEYSAEYSLMASNATAVPTIVAITPKVTTTGKATATVTVSIQDSTGTWSDYMALNAAADKKAKAVKYKATYNVSTMDGTDTAKVDSVIVTYTTGSAVVSGDTADIYTITNNYEDGLQYCQALIKHKALVDSQIKAYISFRNEPKTRKMVSIGTGNGKEQTLILGVSGVADKGINQNKLSIYIDGKPVYNYSYNTETSEVTLTVDNGAAISASYEYGWEAETWREMTKTTTQPYDAAGTYATYFEYTLPTGEEKKTISNIKYVLYRPSGHITDAALGTATGSRQVFVLPHKAKAETIVCSGSWSYDDDTQILTVVAAQETALTISYDYIAESQEVYGVTAGWAED